MTHPFYPTGNPRFNHVAMSLPADLLDATNRADVCRFFDEVLGFTEMEVMTEDRRRLIMSCVHWDQFIFLIAEDDPMKCPRMDHYGFAVGSLDELRGVQRSGGGFRKSDDRMELIDLHVDDQGMVKIHSVYVRYLLPMTIEFQYWEFPEPRPPFRTESTALPVRCRYDLSTDAPTPSGSVPCTPPARRSSCPTPGTSGPRHCSPRSASRRSPPRAAGSPPREAGSTAP